MRSSDWSSEVGSSDLWFRWTAAGGAAQASLLKAEDDPDKAPKDDALRDRQFDMLRTLRDDRARRDAVREQKEQWRRADPSRAPAPAYMGKDVDIVDSALSPHGSWLIAGSPAKDARSEERRVGKECVSTCRSRGSPNHKNNKK